MDVTIGRFPEGPASSLIAQLHIRPADTDDATTTRARAELAELDFAIAIRRTNRTAFEDGAVPERLLHRLACAAAAEQVALFSIEEEPHRAALARLTREADRQLRARRGYQAELRSWTTDDPQRRDGVRGALRLPAHTGSIQRQSMLLLGTDGDQPTDRLRTGEALERVLLTAAMFGHECGPVMQALEIPATRAELRAALGIPFQPQFLFRIGRAAAVPPTARRALDDVLGEP